MCKVSKKYKIYKIKKTNLNNKHKNTKNYNLVGGFIKNAKHLFIANYDDKIKGNLLKEINIIKSQSIKPIEINNDLNLGEPKSEIEAINRSNLFNNIIKYLTNEAQTYFSTQIYIKIPEKFVTKFIDDNIEWIFKCYIEFNFYFNLAETDNLLFANYKKFLELYTKLKYLFDNIKELNDVITKIIRTDDKVIKRLQKKNIDLNPDENSDNKEYITIALNFSAIY